MSPRTLKQYEEIREERREQIMHVALELIASEGFSNVTIAKIAKKASISKGLMYNYFESKEQLIFDITKRGIDEFLRIIDPDKDGVLTHQEFHFFIDQVFDVIQSNFKFWRLYFMIMFQPDVLKVVEPEFNKVMEPFMSITIDYFKRLGAEDPITELRFFGAMMDGISLNYVMDDKNFPLEAVKKKLHNMYN
jgi:AcrR family transcriptional regulator